MAPIAIMKQEEAVRASPISSMSRENVEAANKEAKRETSKEDMSMSEANMHERLARQESKTIAEGPNFVLKGSDSGASTTWNSSFSTVLDGSETGESTNSLSRSPSSQSNGLTMANAEANAAVAEKLKSPPLTPKSPPLTPKSPPCTPSEPEREEVGISELALPKGSDELREYPLATMRLNPEVEDALDLQGASNEYMIFNDELERRSLGKGSAVQMDPQVRDATVKFLLHVAQLVHLPKQNAFQAVSIFDAYCAAAKEAPSTQLPTICVSILRLLRKADSMFDMSDWVAYNKQFVDWLQRLGIEATEGTEDDIEAAEMDILQVLNWHVFLPSVDWWLSAFCARLNVLSQSLLVPSLTMVWQQSMIHLRSMLLRQACTELVSPRRLVSGVFALMMVYGRLLPLEMFRPSHMTVEEWEQLFLSSNLGSATSVPECAMPLEHVDKLVELLQIATGLRVVGLSEDCEMVALLFGNLHN